MEWSIEMKSNYLYKSIPFLSTLFIILLLAFYNQKESTKLKILIWDTPSSSLGTYLAISSGTAYIISFIITTKVANSLKKDTKKILSYKDNIINDESNNFSESNPNFSYDNALIERDFADPSPTIKASFRVIGKTNKNNEAEKINEQNDSTNQYYSVKSEDLFLRREINYKNDNKQNIISNDWNDDAHLNW